jgi:hypothetical protein
LLLQSFALAAAAVQTTSSSTNSSMTALGVPGANDGAVEFLSLFKVTVMT